MANEIEKTIEELEAEVLSELEEANGADAPKKGAAKAEPQLKASDASSVTPGGEVQDMGPAVTSPTDKSGPGTQAGKKAKETSGDAAQKKEGKADSMDTPNDGQKKVAKPIAAGDQVEMSDDQEVISEKEEEVSEMKEMDKMEMIKAMKDMETEMKDMPVEMVKATYDKMKEMMSKEMADMSAEEKEKEALKKEAVEQRIKDINVQEHVDALMSGEGDLSEDFKKKAATVFESAVKSKVRDEVTRLQENYENEIVEGIKSNKSELTEKVDTYMNYVVEEWMKENELAVERGLKGEIAEDFMASLQSVFKEHYIEVPEGKVDLIDELSGQVAELEESLNKSTEDNIALTESVSNLERAEIVRNASSGLALTEAEKLASLVEDIDFDDAESFEMKVNVVKESYFRSEAQETVDEAQQLVGTDEAPAELNDVMARYTQAISKFNK